MDLWGPGSLLRCIVAVTSDMTLAAMLRRWVDEKECFGDKYRTYQYLCLRKIEELVMLEVEMPVAD